MKIDGYKLHQELRFEVCGEEFSVTRTGEDAAEIERVLEESRADLFDGPDPSDEAREELRALRLDIEALKVPKAAKAELIRRVEAAQSKLREPGVVAHVAAERLGRHLEAAAVEARIEARASNGLLSPTMAIDASIGLALSASKAEGDE